MTGPTSLEAVLRTSTLGCEGDPDVGDGVHVALSFDPVLGWPLHPFVCGVLDVDHVETVEAQFFAPDGTSLALGGFDIAEYGQVDVLLTDYGPTPGPWCWVKVVVEGDAVVEAIDPIGAGRPFARRSTAPYSFGASAVGRLRLSGSGVVREIQGFPVGLVQEYSEALQHDPGLSFGLPIDDDSRWYAGGQGEGPAIDRVMAGAPSRLGPPDEPTRPGTPLVPEDEKLRILNVVPSITPWLDAAFHGDELPADAVLTSTTPPDPAVAPDLDTPVLAATTSVACVPGLVMQSGDPGVARYLGLATILPMSPPDGERPLIVVLGAGFGIDPDARLGPWPLAAALPRDTAVTRLLSRFADAEISRLPDVTSAVQDRRRTPRFLTSAAGVAATPDRPSDPEPSTPPGRWRPRRPGEDERWQQEIQLIGNPPAGPVAFARVLPDQVSLHRFVDGRAVALFAGRAAGPPAATTSPSRVGTLSDTAVPVDASGANWLVAQADAFGRWSRSAEVATALPPRPAPPRPVVTIDMRPVALDRSDPTTRSAAGLRVAVTVPVPDAREAGALPLTSLVVEVGGVSTTADASRPGEVVRTLDAPPTAPGAAVAVTVSATFVDTGGTSSIAATSVVTVHDPRPLPVVTTGPALLWAARRDVTGTSELALTWPAAGPDPRYRVYWSTSDRLAPALGLTLIDGRLPGDPLRSSLAGAIWSRRGQLQDRADFSLITDEPLTPVGGVVTVRHALPGSLRGVAFVRVVPLSRGEVEADFAACGLVPVAVPHTERPQAPTVRATAANDGTVTVVVEAAGVSDVVLAATAPGAAPEVRVRRARRTAADPLYVPVIGPPSTTMTPAGPPGTWTARGPGAPPEGLEPYRPTTYWAEVRYPAERTLPPGVDVPVPGAVATPPGVPAGDVESAWSALSLPALITHVPAAVPDITGLLH
ncbi:MAG TPA: hypothetical protein VGE11_02775, partial [Pseudonocardia sp.]